MITSIEYFDQFHDGDWNPHAFLSNFFTGEPILINGCRYATGEHAFQAFKTTDERWASAIANAPTPSEAKRLGRTAPLRPDWEAVKYDVMRMVLAHKFTLGRREGQLLLHTGDALLTEGTHWGDDTWGVIVTKHQPMPDWKGRNWLGHLLMARRAELAAMQSGAPEPRVKEITNFSLHVQPPHGSRKLPTPKMPPPVADAAYTDAELTMLFTVLGHYRILLDDKEVEIPPELDALEARFVAIADAMDGADGEATPTFVHGNDTIDRLAADPFIADDPPHMLKRSRRRRPRRS